MSLLLRLLRGEPEPEAEALGGRKEAAAGHGGEITPAIEQVIREHLAGRPSKLVEVATIVNGGNPAFRGTGHAEMCLAKVDLARGECIGCFPGELREKEPFGSYEDSFGIMTRGGKWLVPTR